MVYRNLVLLHFLDIFMTVLRIFLHLPELYFSHTEQPVNKKSGGTKMMNRLFKRGTVIALAAAMTTSAGILPWLPRRRHWRRQ